MANSGVGQIAVCLQAPGRSYSGTIMATLEILLLFATEAL
jgi:hypothetical protein